MKESDLNVDEYVFILKDSSLLKHCFKRPNCVYSILTLSQADVETRNNNHTITISNGGRPLISPSKTGIYGFRATSRSELAGAF